MPILKMFSWRAVGVALICASAVSVLAACTRDRETEAVPTPVAETPVAVVVGVDAIQAAVVVQQPSGEPVVQAVPVGESDGVTVTMATREDGRTIGTYTVQSGDSIGSIALKFNVEPQELRDMNLLADDLIQVGQILDVPIYPPTPTPPPEPFYHTVAAGESLSQIAVQYKITLPELIMANQLTDPNALRAGMQLVIPGYSPTAAEEGAGTEGEAAASLDPAMMGTHTVMPGETLSKIAAMYGITLGELMQANGITDRNSIRSGEDLRIPGLTQQEALERRSIKHTVQSGESLSQIAQQYGQTLEALMKANLLTDPNALRAGQVLIIPPVE